ncbi:ABC transporter permease [Methanococcoides seepicolus]|uniref:ABC transporter permease n=1 Tax=Methanococcoides seepicolus TaxID=2828780 RepID=A0A9E4ZH78_9EURY|nr:ABC transporter permease [Methanococcoides seepicolus]MCM1987855.1 ABC transporter permease [Methanococcoides seepicolus]
MAINIHNTMVIAKKEFIDHLKSPIFLSFAITFTLVILAWSYVKGMEVEYTSTVLGMPDVMRGFQGVTSVVGKFAPIIGIVLGFDAIVKEIKSNSMNVLLTHPLFRDNIILGKILGSATCILLILFISINIAAGAMLIVSGLPVTMQHLIRIEFFVAITFFYVLFFLALSMMISIIARKANISLLFNIAIWLVITVLFADLIFKSSYILTDSVEIATKQTLNYINFVPEHHYAALTGGMQDVAKESLGSSSAIGGIFDTSYSLSDWAAEFWPNLIILVSFSIVSLIASVIAFLKKDITL